MIINVHTQVEKSEARQFLQPVQYCVSSLAKVSDRNSFRANQNYSNSFRYLYQSQCESFWTNPKNVLYLVWWKTVKNRSDLIRFNTSNNPNESEPILKIIFPLYDKGFHFQNKGNMLIVKEQQLKRQSFNC